MLIEPRRNVLTPRASARERVTEPGFAKGEDWFSNPGIPETALWHKALSAVCARCVRARGTP